MPAEQEVLPSTKEGGQREISKALILRRKVDYEFSG
jgi:hypothetical protein